MWLLPPAQLLWFELQLVNFRRGRGNSGGRNSAAVVEYALRAAETSSVFISFASVGFHYPKLGP